MIREKATSRLNLFWFSHSPQSGGAERMMIEAIEALGSSFNITVGIPKGELDPIWDRLSCPRIILPTGYWVRRKGMRLSSFLALLLKDGILGITEMIRAIRDAKPDVVVTNSIVSPSAAIAAWLLRIPHVWYLHEGLGSAHHGGTLLGKALTKRLASHLSRTLIVNSNFLFEEFRSTVPDGKLRQVTPLLSLPSSAPLSAPGQRTDSLLIAMVGAITPGKRQADAVRAVAKARARGADLALDIIGPGVEPHTGDLRTLIDQYGMSNHITIVGAVPNAAQYLARSHVALVCSESEGLGRVTIEAMSLGVPVIGSRSGATIELVEESGGGFLFNPGSVDELADILVRLSRNRSEISKASWRGRNCVAQRFDPALARDDLFEVFYKAAKSNASEL